MNVQYVDARHPGANHDSLIFNLSDLKTYLQRNAQGNCWILGDAGYPLRPYLMTPFRTADGGSPQARYNTIHAKGRNIVERTIGILKSKFRCLLSVRGLHYSPEKATQIVNICCALHNISQHFRVEFQADEIFIENENMTSQSLNSNIEDTEIGMSIRNNIMRSFQS
ncbi:hypothetical protein DOY81_006880 [Sarcophaga bullata]|nr:hypothetical protein DOY81_006880 [Sarcophaga bullata]